MSMLKANKNLKIRKKADTLCHEKNLAIQGFSMFPSCLVHLYITFYRAVNIVEV